ncbi:hypothetical protein OsJ_25849 [Oryza sativa Japonica Group]|uniref:Methyltransferase type 11 domain-containing protein n=1 Tax=Oryza sativa subsp. japonica TaxID=39947 RepID=B9FYT4_ORYSJ|nr:hypothetical protein OsJ_25849 [Oryza sativa Japonica Group]
MPAADAKPRLHLHLPRSLLLLLIPFLSLLLLYSYSSSPPPPPVAFAVPLSPTPPSPHIRMRRAGFRSYEDYLRHQLNKTLDPRLRRVWATRDWHRKVDAFARAFAALLRDDGGGKLLSNASRALCVGARLGQEVAALRLVGVRDAVGIDLAPAPPLVVRGDFKAKPFANDTFDFEFSNVFDQGLYPGRFVAEIERTAPPRRRRRPARRGAPPRRQVLGQRSARRPRPRRPLPPLRRGQDLQGRRLRPRHRGHPPQEEVFTLTTTTSTCNSLNSPHTIQLSKQKKEHKFSSNFHSDFFGFDLFFANAASVVS